MTKTIIIAEAGVNHNGSVDQALELIDAAVKAGADVVKFQTFNAKQLATKKAPKAAYQRDLTDSTESQQTMLERLSLSKKGFVQCMKHCEKQSIQFLSSAFDIESLLFLTNELNLKQVKLGSGEITNAPLLLAAAKEQRDIILSTGMSTLTEIKEGLGVLAFGLIKSNKDLSKTAFEQTFYSKVAKKILKEKVILMHCNTAYPTPFKDVNLRAIDTLKSEFGLTVGFSDHTTGIEVPVLAVARGAAIVEKHLTFDRSLPGPDHQSSLEPDEFAEMVRGIRKVEVILGSPEKRLTDSEKENIHCVRKSIVAAKPIKKGEYYSKENLAIKRPGTGISPLNFWELLGKKSNYDHQEGDEIK